MKKINEEKFRKELRRRLELIREELSQGTLDRIRKTREEEEKSTQSSIFEVPEGMSSMELREKKEFAFPSEQAKQEQIAIVEAEIESMKKGPVTITQAQAVDFAVRIHDATIGSTGAERVTRMVGIGLGTDEAEIRKVMMEIPTCVDVSYVSKQFEELYAGVWSFTPTLNAVLSQELDTEDFKVNVGIPLQTKKNTAFIKMGNEVISEDRFYEMLDLGEQLNKLEGEQRSGLVAGSGLVTALAVHTSLIDYNPTFSSGEGSVTAPASENPAAGVSGFFDASGVTVAAGAAFWESRIPVEAALVSKQAGEMAQLKFTERVKSDWDVFVRGFKGAAGNRAAAKANFQRQFYSAYMDAWDMANVAADTSTPGRAKFKAARRSVVSDQAEKLAKETFKEAWEKASSGWIKLGTASADDVAKIAASRAVGNKAIAKRAAGEAAEAIVKGSLVRGGLGGVGRGVGKLGTRFIPYVGWALLASDLYNWATNANIDPDSDMIMNSEFHERVKSLYSGYEARQQGALREMQSVPVITEEMVAELERKEEADAAADAREEAERRIAERQQADEAPLGAGNFEYKVDRTTGCWMTRPQGSIGDFTSLRGNDRAMAELDRRFPSGRTPAMIAMCTSGTGAVVPTPGGGAGAGGGDVIRGRDDARRTQQELPQVTPRSRGRMSWKDVRIDLRSDATGGTIPLSRVSKDAANFLAFDLIKGLPETRALGTLSGTAINPERVISLKMYRDGNKVRIEKVKLFGKTGRAELNRFIAGGDNIVFNSLNSNLTKDQKQFFEKRNGIEVDLIITIPRGVYTRDVSPPARQVDVAEQEAIAESKIRKAVRREILKQLLS